MTRSVWYVIAAAWVVIGGLLPTTAAATVIMATATGSTTPSTVTFPGTVTNGDFLITGSAAAPVVGDGLDENTTWTFDFNGDPNFGSFSTSAPLASAELTMTLTTDGALINTDGVRIEGLGNIFSPIIQGLPTNTTATVTLELLDFYPSSAILGVFTGGMNGQIPMFYGDDAIVSSAQLALRTVPEPSALALMAIGLAGVGFAGRRKLVASLMPSSTK